MRKRLKSIDWTPVVIVAVMLFFVLLAVSKGWLGGFGDFRSDIYSSQFNPDTFSDDSEEYSVNLFLDPNSLCVGDICRGTIESNMPGGVCTIFIKPPLFGWQVYNTLALNSVGKYYESNKIDVAGKAEFVAICCDADKNCKISNFATLTADVCDSSIPPSYDAGDVVGGGSGSGSLIGGGGESVYFDLSGVEVGGDCYLGAKIKTQWIYDLDEKCYGIQGQQGLQWFFSDSSGIVWSYADAFPQYHNENLCPLNWDGVTPWKLSMFPTMDLPDCKLNYAYDVQIYVCECN